MRSIDDKEISKSEFVRIVDMFCFLTSNCFRENTSRKWEMIPDNHMIEELRLHFPKSCRGVFVCSDPYCEDNDYYLKMRWNEKTLGLRDSLCLMREMQIKQKIL